mgnify:CR=1 FL=1
MRYENKTRTNRPDRHTAHTAAATAHTDSAGGYTPAEHARALDLLLEDIFAQNEEAGEQDSDRFAGRCGTAIEPKLRVVGGTDRPSPAPTLGALAGQPDFDRPTLRIA